jgi:Protein of unknown function (DUF2911)/Tetratricopeptide repeat
MLRRDPQRMKTALVSVLAFASMTGLAVAQPAQLTEPQESPAAKVTQTIGLTEIEVDYHRPAVKGRKIWGGLVPYGEVWRAGANENTIVRFSTDVKIEGKALAAGTYGLHMIPTQKGWTVVFSKVSSAWGSFTYEQKEDALRVAVSPRTTAGNTEYLLYRFDDPATDKGTLVLAWEKLEVPVGITVDTAKITMARMKSELRGLPNFFWHGWNQAALYWANHGGSLDEALAYADKSVKMNPQFANQMTRATILEKKGKAAEAKEQRTKALAVGSEQDVNAYGYALLGQKKLDEAVALFQTNVKAHPESWNAHDSLAEALASKGDKKGAIESYEKALSMVKDPVQKKRIEQTLAQLKSAS